MRINLLDASFIRKGGHSFDFDRKLLRHYAEAGHEVRLYTYAGADDAAVAQLAEHGPATKLFRSFHYSLPAQIDPYAGELNEFLRKSETLAEDLQAIEEADVWLWPTFSAEELHACAVRAPGVPVVGCIHSDPGIEARSMGAIAWRAALLCAQRKGLACGLGSVEPELRHRFAPIVPAHRFAVFPQPFDGEPDRPRREKLRRIGFFGSQRGEKGAKLMAGLIERLLADGYAITLQNSNERYGWADAPGLDIIGFVEDIATPMAECDLIVLPYDIESYRAKGSGVLAQALALGIPATAPLGTLPGRTIEQNRAGPLFAAVAADAIHAAIRFAAANYAAFAGNAWRASQQFAKRNGTAQFAEALLAAAR